MPPGEQNHLLLFRQSKINLSFPAFFITKDGDTRASHDSLATSKCASESRSKNFSILLPQSKLPRAPPELHAEATRCVLCARAGPVEVEHLARGAEVAEAVELPKERYAARGELKVDLP